MQSLTRRCAAFLGHIMPSLGGRRKPTAPSCIGNNYDDNSSSSRSSSRSSDSRCHFSFVHYRQHSGTTHMCYKIDFFQEYSRVAAHFVESTSTNNIHSIILVSDKVFHFWLKTQSDAVVNWINASNANAAAGNRNNNNHTTARFPGNKLLLLPASGSDIPSRSVLFFKDEDVKKLKYKAFDHLPQSLFHSKMVYKAEVASSADDNDDTSVSRTSAILEQFCTSWALNSYQFNFYKNQSQSTLMPPPKSPQSRMSTLIWPPEVSDYERLSILSLAKSYTLMRDLTDSPALSLGPEELEVAASTLLSKSGAVVNVIRGVDDLVKNNYPQIAAVGMGAAGDRQPRLVDAYWTPPRSIGSGSDTLPPLPEVVLVGKGVIFDSGGLNIKGSSGMRTMKKDMAGAAQALALALHIMEMKLPVNLRVLLPIVENSISGPSMRPGDVIVARNGKTTEITNTDAEGRLILADALCAANEPHSSSSSSSSLSSPSPTLIVDFATLTGAARVALGNEIPALFSNNEEEAMKLWKLSRKINDELWVLPLAHRYRNSLKSSIADIVNSVEGPGGAIIAALYLHEFAIPSTAPKIESSSSTTSVSLIQSQPPTWFHIDFMGLEKGKAEPQGMRAIYEYIKTGMK